jgi:RNA recognition motif-containing protein
MEVEEAPAAAPAAEKHFVMVGESKWPAHPTTVAVSDLAPETHENDIVAVMKRAGAMIHVRVIRDKKTKLGSGKGLVQFETAASVDAALAMSGEVGVNGRFIKVERSRFPAIAVVTNTGQPAKPKPDKPKPDKTKPDKPKEAEPEAGAEEVKQVEAKPAPTAPPKKNTLFRPSKPIIRKKIGADAGATKSRPAPAAPAGDSAPKSNAAFAAMFK